jgi:DNA uptake protein ComE-like DNA-binding protein
MNIFKSHFFRHNKAQRNGIFFFVLLIVVVQFIFSFVDFAPDEVEVASPSELLAFQQQIDRLKVLEIENRKPKIFPFNPNYITDHKGEQLGMSLVEVDRLLAFRMTGKFVNSKHQFQQVTKVSDSLLSKISRYFKFPDWVTERNRQKEKVVYRYDENIALVKRSDELSTTDLNIASSIDFQFVEGVNASLSERIVKYRSKLQGFSFEDQLYEVFNIAEHRVQKILKTFKIVQKPKILKLNINTVGFKELLQNPYIDYALCQKIFNYRDEVAELQEISELKNIINFPMDKYDRIVLYLIAE